jgi:branched-chain amino acid transport system permease protein
MFLTAILVLGALHLVLTRTPLAGRCGPRRRIRTRRPCAGSTRASVHRGAAAIAVALAGLAGIFLALRAQVTPFSGTDAADLRL